ncbi:MAG: TIGR02757 family protein [Spirochaetaceae bacterium]|jgi:uncharacterized protein (TIGR02757 family)|nr:TIGR02757 family protein [Spirochaetaceae bacterium]
MLIDKTTELILEDTYKKFLHRDFVKPDPLQFLYEYTDIKDREIVGLLASSLALGRVNSIIQVITQVLRKLPSPYENLKVLSNENILDLFDGFKYRFYSQKDLGDLLQAIKRVIGKYGSLNNCFLAGYNESDKTILPALAYFVNSLNGTVKLKMLADPTKNSACKRLQLYLRWMIRHDDIDPGGWEGVPRSKLIIPLDTHIYKISKMFQLTSRNDGGMKTALEITENLKKYDREDPIRFDFSLTRPGIHPELDYSEFEQ